MIKRLYFALTAQLLDCDIIQLFSKIKVHFN